MKNKILLAIIAVAVSVTSYAQKNLTLSGGGNFPMGDFHSTDRSNPNAGFAKTGGTFELTYGQMLYKKIGVIATFRGQLNGLDAKALATIFNIPLSADPYKSLMVLVGPFVEFELNEKLALDVKLQGGVISTSFPEYKLKDLSGGSADVNASAATTSGLSFGVILRRKLTERFGVNLTIDYLIAEQTFDAQETSGGNILQQNKQRTPINVINSMIGISYIFGK
jgi:hypothetical protein